MKFPCYHRVSGMNFNRGNANAYEICVITDTITLHYTATVSYIIIGVFAVAKYTHRKISLTLTRRCYINNIDELLVLCIFLYTNCVHRVTTNPSSEQQSRFNEFPDGRSRTCLSSCHGEIHPWQFPTIHVFRRYYVRGIDVRRFRSSIHETRWQWFVFQFRDVSSCWLDKGAVCQARPWPFVETRTPWIIQEARFTGATPCTKVERVHCRGNVRSLTLGP